MQLILFADGLVGRQITRWLLQTHHADVRMIVTTGENKIWNDAIDAVVPCVVFESQEQIADELNRRNINPTLGLLAWWPRIIKEKLLNIPTHGFINTHPSLLPHNRGKHYNFWAIVEEAPFGVTLHFVELGIDSGDIIAQQQIDYDWEDTGKSLYERAQTAMISLFVASYPAIRRMQFERKAQKAGDGSFHRASELAAASIINLDQKYTARDLLNRLRARTFEGYPACWFEDRGQRYEIRTQIRRIEDDAT